MAAVFSAVAVIFSALIPPIDGVNTFTLKTALTVVMGLIGFLLFPDLAARVTYFTITLFNMAVSKISMEVLNQFLRLQGHGHTNAPVSAAKPLILDTSAIIDGRILEIARANFLSGIIMVPNFVLLELQQVADSGDSLKRQRGRRGFEIIQELKKIRGVKVEIWDSEVAGKLVDEKLLKLAKSLNGKIITTDFNLNKLAEAHLVVVLNVNDLANALKTPALPGEKLELKIVHIGKDPSQGVGYLPDGTMIVVEDGGGNLGKEIKTEVSRVLQGSAGRMIFAKKTP